jgi:mannose-6-phosphate isomerase-like protein (cupin superfamily)
MTGSLRGRRGNDALDCKPEGERRIHLKPGVAFIVPQGVWHTATIERVGDLLSITRGAGTEIR